MTMTKEVKIVLFDGFDRTGKDTIANQLSYEKNICKFHHAFMGYELTRNIFKQYHDDPSFVNDVSRSMAISELIQVVSQATSLVELDIEDPILIVPRSFVSTLIYDAVRRGFVSRHDLGHYEKIIELEEKRSGIKLNFVPMVFTTSVETMKERGSAEDSFEVLRYGEVSEFTKRTIELIHTSESPYIKKPIILHNDGCELFDFYKVVKKYVYSL